MMHEPAQQQSSLDHSPTDSRRTQSASALAAIKTQLPAQQQCASSPTMTGAREKAPTMLAAVGRSSTNFLAMSSNFFMGTALRDDKVTSVTIAYDEPGPLFVDLFSRPDGKGAYVKAFRRAADGAMGRAEASGQVRVNDELYAINGCVVADLLFSSIIQAAKSATFPLTLVFRCHVPEALEAQPPLPRRNSLLPPASPARGGRTTSFSSDWTAKLGQMMAESGIKRSSSFEKKLDRQSGASAATGSSSPASSASGTGSGDTPTGLVTPGKPKQIWSDGLSLDKMKHSGSDGMKNLLRMIGGKSRPEEDRETVNMWFEQLLLRPDSSIAEHDSSGGPVNSLYHSTPIVTVTAGGRMLAVRDDDASEFAVSWYRKTPENDLIHIKGAKCGRYFPSVDDVGTRLSAQVTSLRFPPLARVVEFPRPLQIDPAVGELVDILLDAGAGSFSATLASNEHDSFQLKISSARVVLVKISEDDDDAGVVVDAPYDAHLQVLLDPTDQLRFTLKVKEFGSFLGNRRGDTCRRVKETTRKSVRDGFADYSCFFLVAQNPQHRDILALLIRKFRARALPSELEDQAYRDEINLFMDPAFACASLSLQSPERRSGSSTAQSQSQHHAATFSSSSLSSPSANANSNGAGRASTSSASFLASGGATAANRNSFSTASYHQHRSSLDTTRTQRSASDVTQSVSARIIDLFNLDHEGELVNAPLHGREQLAPSRSPTAMAPAPAATAGPDAFLQSRIASQEKQLAMLQDKLSSLAVLLQATEHEKKQIEAAVEVKDTRIEAQQSKIQALEKLTAHHTSQSRELQALRTKLEDDERARATLQQQLDAALALNQATLPQRCDHETQTESCRQQQQATGDASTDSGGADGDNWVGDDIASQLSPRSINFEMDYMAATLTKVQQQLADRTRELAQLQDAQSTVIAERNAFRAKTHELGKELRKLVTANRSLADIEAQLAERSTLATQLAVAKAEAKRASDESKEYKDALECVMKQRGMGDKDKDTQRVLSQNLDLQRVVHQLTDSLNESKEQLAAMKSINSALMDKLHALQPDARGSILFESPLNSPSSVTSARANPTFSSDGEDNSDSDDNDDSDDDDEGFAGSAVTGVITHAL